jgi:hypothetical protein
MRETISRAPSLRVDPHAAVSAGYVRFPPLIPVVKNARLEEAFACTRRDLANPGSVTDKQPPQTSPPMKQAAAKEASTADSSRRTEPASGPRGIALAPPDCGIDLVDRLSASDRPIQLRSPRARQQKNLLGLSNSRAALAPEPNNTGLPDGLKSGVESLSGMSLDHVEVHYNSYRPAQLDALAYAQGGEIHVAPGQERHLPHEAWHVVQQAQGRVQPTMQLRDGLPVNDEKGLEREADVMGEKALQMRLKPTMQMRDGVSVYGRPKAGVRFSDAPKSGMDQSRVASLTLNRIATVQRRVGRADGVAAMNADQVEKWLKSQGQWDSISGKVAGVIDEMMRSDHQWTYGGFFSYLLVQDAKALVDVHYRQGVIHGDLKGVDNQADFHVDPGDGRRLRADMLTVARDVSERMTAANVIHGAPKGRVYLRPQGAAIIKIVSQMLGEALGDKRLIEQAHQAIQWRKFKEAALDKVPFYTRPKLSKEVLDKSVVPEHSAYMKSLVGVSGVDIKPLLGGARSMEEFTQNMLEESEMGRARLGKYLETVESATAPVSMDIFISQDRLSAVISLLQKQG